MPTEIMPRQKTSAKSLHTAYEVQNTEQQISESDDFTVERYEQFLKFSPRGTVRVLDIGCNTGRGGVRLKELNPLLQIDGLDCVQNRLDQLPDSYTQGIYGLSNDIPVEDGSYDVVVAGEFLEHLYPGDVDQTLCEFQRVLKTGGRLLLTTPNPHYLKLRLQRDTIYGISHLTQHYPSVLKYRLKLHGFSHVRVRGSGRMSRYVGSHFPWRAVYGSYLITGDKY